MSWDALRYVQRMKVAPNGEKLTKGEKLLLFALAYYHHDERGDAWASLSHLADESLHTRPGVIVTLQSLADKGIIEIVRDPNAAAKKQTNRYRFTTIPCGTSHVTLPVTSHPALPALVISDDQASHVTLPATSHPTLPNLKTLLDLTKNPKEGEAAPTAPACGVTATGSDSKTTGKPRGHRASVFPDGWEVEPWMIELCKGFGLNPHAEFRDFKNNHKAKGTLFVSWPHAFRTWVSRSVGFKQRRGA